MIAPDFEAMQSMRSKDVFYVHWNLGKRCNFDCVYCPDSLHDFTSSHKSIDDLKKVAINLINKIDKPYIRIWFTGGEPTVNPNFLEFCQWLKESFDNKFVIGLNTNGSRNWGYYVNLLYYVDTIQFSSHFEFMEQDKFMQNLSKTNKFVKLNKNVGKIPPNRFRFPNVSLNLMMEPEYWDRAVQLILFCEKNEIEYSMKRIRTKANFTSNDRQYSPVYTKEQIKFLNDRSYREIQLDEYEFSEN